MGKEKRYELISKDRLWLKDNKLNEMKEIRSGGFDIIDILNEQDSQLTELKAKYDNLYKCYQKTSQSDLKDKYDFSEENEKLKAENERLKDARRFETKASNKKTQDMFNKWANDVRDLQQQLKDKDELQKATDESLYASRELYEKEKTKRWGLEKQLKNNTKQICEKVMNRAKTANALQSVRDDTITLSQLKFILELIKKGAENEE